MDAGDTIAAIATPMGESGIGMVRLSGPAALRIVQAHFRSRRAASLDQAPSHTSHVGAFDDLDHAVVTLFRRPHSYTGEDVAEISVHGNPLILRRVLERCLEPLPGQEARARLAAPGEFTQRAFLNGKMDLAQAEAVADLIRAQTDAARRAAFRQLEGSLSWQVRGMRDQILPILAHIEVGLDHSDEDHDFLPREQLTQRCAELREAIRDILGSARVGRLLRDGLRVALVGPPNAGKSSLLNALLKEERAIVTPIPGTTRDTLEERLDWDGLPVRLIDTAGLREHTLDPVEAVGMERTRAAIAAADLVLVVLDRANPAHPEGEAVLSLVRDRPHRILANKSDIARTTLEGKMIAISALTGEGLDQVITAVKEFAYGTGASVAESEWLLNVRHAEALKRAQDAIDRADAASKAQAYEEVVALELRTALDALGEIIGVTSSEDLLGQIFSTFCVGK